jgi:peptidoglycan hydrolase CwlO-like protein
MEQIATVPVDPLTKRAMWKIALAAVLAAVLLLGAVAGGYAVYHEKTTQISDLKAEGQHLRAEGQHLRATNTALYKQMKATQAKLGRANSKLTVSRKQLTRTKANLTKLSKDLAAANQRADANYSAGYSAGNSAGYEQGNASGYSSGLSAGSDQLTCSDDVDVYWLPACNY